MPRSVEKRLSGVAERRMLVPSGPQLGAGDCVYDLRATQWPVEAAAPHTRTWPSRGVVSQLFCLYDRLRGLEPRRLLMNDPGSSRGEPLSPRMPALMFASIVSFSCLHIRNTKADTCYYAHFIMCYFRDAWL